MRTLLEIEAMNRVILYARVSTKEQKTDRQITELRKVAANADWEIIEELTEVVSGGKGVEERPLLKAALDMLTRREADRLCVLSVDRLGRSTLDLLQTLQTIHSVGAHLFIHTPALDTTTPAGEAMFGLLGIFAKFERRIISERVKSGIERKKQKEPNWKPGKKLVIEGDKLQTIKQLRSEGISWRKIETEVGIPQSSIRTFLNRKTRAA